MIVPSHIAALFLRMAELCNAIPLMEHRVERERVMAAWLEIDEQVGKAVEQIRAAKMVEDGE